MESELTSISIVTSAKAAPRWVGARANILTTTTVISSDIIAVLLSTSIALLAEQQFRSISMAPSPGPIFLALTLVLTCFTAAGLYPGISANPVEEIRLITISLTLALTALWSGTVLLHELTPHRLVSVLTFIFCLILVPCFRHYTRKIFCSRSWWGYPVAILGYGHVGRFLLQKLREHPELGLKPYAVLDDNPETYSHLEDVDFRGPLARCVEIASHYNGLYGILCMPGVSRRRLLEIFETYGPHFGYLMVVLDLVGMSTVGICAKEVGGIVGLQVRQQLLRPTSKLLKRVLDIGIAIAVSPIVALALVISVVFIKLESPGPAFHANERIGYRGRKFKTWKLRSMIVDGNASLDAYLDANPKERATWTSTQKLKNDPRVTRIGRIMRKTSIDELPQFWNVLKGDMSVVGPRPILANQITMYGSSFHLYEQVRPGITGLWQVSGRNHLSFQERVQLDRYVIQNWSVWLDLYILARTLRVVLTGKGAY